MQDYFTVLYIRAINLIGSLVISPTCSTIFHAAKITHKNTFNTDRLINKRKHVVSQLLFCEAHTMKGIFEVKLNSLDHYTLKQNTGRNPRACQEYTLTVGIMLELGFCLQMTKWENLIKYRICKSICAADYKGSASLNPQSDISPNGSYINQWTNQIFLRRPPLHFVNSKKKEGEVVSCVTASVPFMSERYIDSLKVQP